MSCFIEMFCRMLVWRVVTTTDVTALHAEAKMHPPAADSQTIFTTVCARRDLFDLIQMCATLRHLNSPFMLHPHQRLNDSLSNLYSFLPPAVKGVRRAAFRLCLPLNQ
jgi:hypothetical protein